MRVNYIGKYYYKILICEHTLSIIHDRLGMQRQKSLNISVAFSNKRFGFCLFACFVFLSPATYPPLVNSELCSLLSSLGVQGDVVSCQGEPALSPKLFPQDMAHSVSLTLHWPKHITLPWPTTRGWRVQPHQIPGSRKIINRKCSYCLTLKWIRVMCI